MKVNISYIKKDKPLKDSMYLTLDGWENTDIDITRLDSFVGNDCIQYSPYSFTSGRKVAENWSNDKQNLLIFDIDDGMSINEASLKFKNYCHIITTTKNHLKVKKDKVCDRFRIILPAINIPKGKIYWYMLQVMAEEIPMDIQVNIPTGAFLGNTGAITIYNNVSNVYDCTYASEVAEEKMIQELKKKERDNMFKHTANNSIDLKEIKSKLDKHIVLDIFDNLGLKIKGSFAAIRENDRTPSAKVYDSGYIIDYGGGFKGDIFDYLHRYYGMNFRDSIEFVRRFIDG